MKKWVYLLMMVLAVVLVACSSDDDEPQSSTTVPVDEDDDETTATLDDSYTYKLPVIFHVFYQDATDVAQYIPASRLKDILARVNELYRGDVYGREFGTSENMKIQFVLASYDENGGKLAVPGVEYVRWTGAWPINPSEFMDNHSGYVKYIWEPNEYINVMLYHFTDEEEGEVLGISHLPYTLQGINETGGLTALEARYANMTKRNLSFAYCSSINSKYANTDASGNYFETDRYTNLSHKMFEHTLTLQQLSHDIHVTLAHELGHYLGLLHVFTEFHEGEGDRLLDSDYCQDTPTYNREAYMQGVNEYLGGLREGETVSARRLMTRHDYAGNEFYSSNIMDYAYTYGYELTAEQKARTRAVLYDSPLIPGPKKRLRAPVTAKMAARAVDGVVDLPVRTIKCTWPRNETTINPI